jgi:hypothetical protein
VGLLRRFRVSALSPRGLIQEIPESLFERGANAGIDVVTVLADEAGQLGEMRVNGQRIATWSSQHGWSGL